MDEFVNRIDVQREVISIVNKNLFLKEQLFSISKKAVDRWLKSNHIEASIPLVQILNEISEKLFFIANKSQEQITEEYKLQSEIIVRLIDRLAASIDTFNRK